MKPWLAATALFLVLGISPARAADDPWAAARAGKIECTDPDFDKKTCSGMGTYTFNNDGSATTIERGYFDPWPDLLVYSAIRVTFEGSRSCHILTTEDIALFTFERHGKAVSTDEAEATRQQFMDMSREQFGRNFCVDISPYGSIFTELPDATKHIAYIDAADGFSLVSPGQE